MLRKDGQAFFVKFTGEGSEDAGNTNNRAYNNYNIGGLYRDALYSFTQEIQSKSIPLFIPCPNGVLEIGQNREKVFIT